MIGELLLRVAYGANVVILAPVLAGLLLARNGPGVPALGGEIAESRGLRLLLVSLWSAILALSLAGLVAPRLFWSILLLQIIYKSLWLALYVAPLWRAKGPRATPWGPAIVFAAIVVLWPVALAIAARDGALSL